MTTLIQTESFPSRNRRWVLGAVAVVGLALAALLIFDGLALHSNPQVAPPNPVAAAAPGWIDIEGGIQPLGVRTEGVIEKIGVHEGQQVRKGDLLLRLDGQALELESKSASLDVERHRSEATALQAHLNRARADFARLKPLVAQKAEPADELRNVQAQISELESQLSLAGIAIRAAQLQERALQEKQKRLEIRANSNGQILKINAHAGDLVAPGHGLLSFVGDGPHIVRAELDERLFGLVAPGMRAEVSPEYDDMKVYDARVLRVADTVGPVSSLPEVHGSSKDDRVVECVLSIEDSDLLIGQRVLVRVMRNP